MLKELVRKTKKKISATSPKQKMIFEFLKDYLFLKNYLPLFIERHSCEYLKNLLIFSIERFERK